MKKTLSKKTVSKPLSEEYGGLIGGIAELLEASRRIATRTVNALMTATYWEIGRRIVEFEQRGKKRAEYGEELLQRLAQDLTARFGRGFSYPNVNKFRQFYLALPSGRILSIPSIESTPPIVSTASIESQPKKGQTSSGELPVRDLAARFPLPWSHYVRLLSTKSAEARRFYETEALRGGWSVRQLDRQIASQFYERTAASRNKNAMLRKGAAAAIQSLPMMKCATRSFSNSSG